MPETSKNIERDKSASRLMESLALILRPIIRFCIGRINFPAFVNLARELYVSEARLKLSAQSGNRVTYSGLALTTGIEGRAIKSTEERCPRPITPGQILTEAAVLELWQSDPDFLDSATHEPRQLLVHGPGQTFQGLVKRAAGRSITPLPLLDRLLVGQHVELTNDGAQVRLLNSHFFPMSATHLAEIESASRSINRFCSDALKSDRFIDSSESPSTNLHESRLQEAT